MKVKFTKISVKSCAILILDRILLFQNLQFFLYIYIYIIYLLHNSYLYKDKFWYVIVK